MNVNKLETKNSPAATLINKRRGTSRLGWARFRRFRTPVAFDGTVADPVRSPEGLAGTRVPAVPTPVSYAHERRAFRFVSFRATVSFPLRKNGKIERFHTRVRREAYIRVDTTGGWETLGRRPNKRDRSAPERRPVSTEFFNRKNLKG